MEIAPPDPQPTAGELRLRAWRDDDLADLVRCCNDPDVGRFIPPIPIPYQGRRPAFMAGTSDGLSLCIADAQTDLLLGAIGIRILDAGAAQLGYWVAPEARRRGVATQALTLLSRWAIAHLRLERVQLFTDVENPASMRVAERAGLAARACCEPGTSCGENAATPSCSRCCRRIWRNRGVRAGVTRLPLPIEPPYDFERSTFRFRMFGDDLASRWIDGGLHRVLRSGLAVRLDAGGITAWGEPGPADLAEVSHLLGGRFDVAAFAAAHPQVHSRAPGFRPPLLADPFEMLVTSVTAQQISLRAACIIRGGLILQFGRLAEHDARQWWAFPRQEDVRGGDLTGIDCRR